MMNDVNEFTAMEVPLEEIISMTQEICNRHSSLQCEPDFQYERFFLKKCQQLIQLVSDRKTLLKKLDFKLTKDKKVAFYSKVEPFVEQLGEDLVNEFAQLGLCYIERDAGDQSKIEALVDELDSACKQLKELFDKKKAQLVTSIPGETSDSKQPKVTCFESPTKVKPASSTDVPTSSCMATPQPVEPIVEQPPPTNSHSPRNVATEARNFIIPQIQLKQTISLCRCYAKTLLEDDSCSSDYMYEEFFLKNCQSFREFCSDRIARLPAMINSFSELRDRQDFCQQMEQFMQQQYTENLVNVLKELSQCYLERGLDRAKIKYEINSVADHGLKLRKTFCNLRNTVTRAVQKSALNLYKDQCANSKINLPKSKPS